jgi:hypothetical protein
MVSKTVLYLKDDRNEGMAQAGIAPFLRRASGRLKNCQGAEA